MGTPRKLIGLPQTMPAVWAAHATNDALRGFVQGRGLHDVASPRHVRRCPALTLRVRANPRCVLPAGHPGPHEVITAGPVVDRWTFADGSWHGLSPSHPDYNERLYA